MLDGPGSRSNERLQTTYVSRSTSPATFSKNTTYLYIPSLVLHSYLINGQN